MVNPGRLNTLKVLRRDAYGVRLDGGRLGELVLPAAEAPPSLAEGETVEAFVYLDGDAQPVVTLRRPLAQLDEVAALRVVNVSKVGAFLDWGMPKDLLLPFGEQRERPEPGRVQVVKVIADRDGRLVASARLDNFLSDTATEFAQNDQVDLIVVQRSEIGYKVVVNGRYWGLIHGAEIRAPLRRGQRLTGYVQRLREDRRLSISLNPPGAVKSDELAARILERLESEGDFLPLSDRSSPEAIFEAFRCSKGAFKQAIGKLYKARRIVIEAEGIRLAHHAR